MKLLFEQFDSQKEQIQSLIQRIQILQTQDQQVQFLIQRIQILENQNQQVQSLAQRIQIIENQNSQLTKEIKDLENQTQLTKKMIQSQGIQNSFVQPQAPQTQTGQSPSHQNPKNQSQLQIPQTQTRQSPSNQNISIPSQPQTPQNIPIQSQAQSSSLQINIQDSKGVLSYLQSQSDNLIEVTCSSFSLDRYKPQNVLSSNLMIGEVKLIQMNGFVSV
jgi:hypothetical protein